MKGYTPRSNENFIDKKSRSAEKTVGSRSFAQSLRKSHSSQYQKIIIEVTLKIREKFSFTEDLKKPKIAKKFEKKSFICFSKFAGKSHSTE